MGNLLPSIHRKIDPYNKNFISPYVRKKAHGKHAQHEMM